MDKNSTDKITVNLSVVDLGYIDLLVDQGFFANRTDFIKNAIRLQIDSHQNVLDKWLSEKYKRDYFFVGISIISESQIKEHMNKQETIELTIVGLLVIPPTVNADDLFSVYSKITVYGVARCSKQMKEHYQL